MKLRKSILILTIFLGALKFPRAAENSSSASSPPISSPAVSGTIEKADLKNAVGKWRSIDDETKKPKSIIEISTDGNGKLIGKIIQLFREPNEDQNPKCDKCKGERKDQAILGMQIMSGFMRVSDNKWAEGEILDPKNGKTYSCKLTLIEEGKRMEVRGFIGFSLLGRTQIWERVL